MARPKTPRKSRPPKRQTYPVVTVAILGVLFGAVIGICAVGLQQLFQVAGATGSYRSVVVIPSHSPTASPSPGGIPAGWRPVSAYSVPILMYHHIRVLPPRDQMARALSVNPDIFAKQLDYLKNHGYTTITFAQLQQGILPPKPIILTFDDGSADAYTAAWPALRERGMAGVFYVVSGFVGDANSITWDQLREMHSAGMEIGAHTVTHPDLAISSVAEQRHQVNDSVRTIDEHLGSPIVTFAYPSGKHNPDTVKLVEAAGISYAVTTDPGVATSTDNAELLPRYRITETTDFSALLP